MIRLYLAGAALVSIAGLGLYAWGLNSKLDLAQAERDTALGNAAVFQQSLLTERQSRERAEQLNATYLEDLRNAKAAIDADRDAVESGRGELHVNAECPDTGSVPGTTATERKPNATAPRLSDTAIKNHFLLRERHAEAVNQILGLQAYIKEFCTNKKASTSEAKARWGALRGDETIVQL